MDSHVSLHYLFASPPAAYMFWGSPSAFLIRRWHQNRRLLVLKQKRIIFHFVYRAGGEMDGMALTKQCIFEIELRLCCIWNEKLACICIWTTVGHRNHTTIGVLQILLEFVFEFSTPYAVSTFAGARWIARLHNESFYISMKQRTFVVVAGTQCQKVFTRFRTIVAKQLDFDIANVRM